MINAINLTFSKLLANVRNTCLDLIGLNLHTTSERLLLIFNSWQQNITHAIHVSNYTQWEAYIGYKSAFEFYKNMFQTKLSDKHICVIHKDLIKGYLTIKKFDESVDVYIDMLNELEVRQIRRLYICTGR